MPHARRLIWGEHVMGMSMRIEMGIGLYHHSCNDAAQQTDSQCAHDRQVPLGCCAVQRGGLHPWGLRIRVGTCGGQGTVGAGRSAQQGDRDKSIHTAKTTHETGPAQNPRTPRPGRLGPSYARPHPPVRAPSPPPLFPCTLPPPPPSGHPPTPPPCRGCACMLTMLQ